MRITTLQQKVVIALALAPALSKLSSTPAQLHAATAGFNSLAAYLAGAQSPTTTKHHETVAMAPPASNLNQMAPQEGEGGEVSTEGGDE